MLCILGSTVHTLKCTAGCTTDVQPLPRVPPLLGGKLRFTKQAHVTAVFCGSGVAMGQAGRVKPHMRRGVSRGWGKVVGASEHQPFGAREDSRPWLVVGYNPMVLPLRKVTYTCTVAVGLLGA